MKHNFIFICCSLIFICLTSSKCEKDKSPINPVDQLPPATQTGANTFGCLVNGEVWIPKDNYGQATFSLYADPTFENGVFGVTAIKYYDAGKFQQISFGSDTCTNSGVYPLGKPHNRAQFMDIGKSLMLISDNQGVKCTGTMSITKYDLQNRIFSGTFEFTIYNTVGDTIRITHGRFDKKL